MSLSSRAIQEAHRYFSTMCFNQTWEILEKESRSPEEEDLMVQLSQASYYHWRQRNDFKPENISVALWLISRVYSVLNQSRNARIYGQRCLQYSQANNLKPFYIGYAYEALTRAETSAMNREQAQDFLRLAEEMLTKVGEKEENALLKADLNFLRDQLYEKEN